MTAIKMFCKYFLLDQGGTVSAATVSFCIANAVSISRTLEYEIP